MTPVFPEPSVHQVVVDTWEPNEIDLSAGVVGGFGTTINILLEEDGCGFGAESDSAFNRI